MLTIAVGVALGIFAFWVVVIVLVSALSEAGRLANQSTMKAGYNRPPSVFSREAWSWKAPAAK